MKTSLLLAAALLLGACNSTSVVEPTPWISQVNTTGEVCDPPEVMTEGVCRRPQLPKE